MVINAMYTYDRLLMIQMVLNAPKWFGEQNPNRQFPKKTTIDMENSTLVDHVLFTAVSP